MDTHVRIIAEGAINHNGQRDLAIRLVEVARDSGADYVKLQSFMADYFIAPGSSYASIFQNAELGLQDFRVVRDHAAALGIPFFSTAADQMGLEMIVKLDLPIIKIGSSNITNEPLLSDIAATRKPVILSTGASTLSEVDRAMQILRSGVNDLVLMHCTALYPAPDSSLNLSAMGALRAAFPGVRVGYSDHSLDWTASVAAVAMGAKWLERHFTSDKTLPGPDHQNSDSPDELRAYVGRIRRVEEMLGNGQKAPAAGEEAIRLGGRRYLTAAGDLGAGARLTKDNIRPRRIEVQKVQPAMLLAPGFRDTVIGWRTTRKVADGEPLTWANVTPGGDAG
jgi:N,N'-diacetyllegionaminate synthase